MKSRLRHPVRSLKEPFGKAGLTVAILALVFAMLGGAYAATNSGGKATASAKAKPGPRGKTGKTGKTGPAGPAGAAGPAGPAGPAGAAGKNGTNGTNGKEGSPWTAGGTLPTGSTETGSWAAVGVPAEFGLGAPGIGTAISFTIPLLSELGSAQVHYIKNGESPPPGCTGNVSSPGAEEGNLCVFAQEEVGVENVVITPKGELALGASTAGSVLYALTAGPPNTPAHIDGTGTWAVTG